MADLGRWLRGDYRVPGRSGDSGASTETRHDSAATDAEPDEGDEG
jgi:hypothetical protein